VVLDYRKRGIVLSKRSEWQTVEIVMTIWKYPATTQLWDYRIGPYTWAKPDQRTSKEKKWDLNTNTQTHTRRKLAYKVKMWG
jgi:hypothetical protein